MKPSRYAAMTMRSWLAIGLLASACAAGTPGAASLQPGVSCAHCRMLGNPRAIPSRTLDYAKYDLVRVFNQLVDALGLRESMVESVLSRAIAMPAARFLRMKRSVSLLVSDRAVPGTGAIVEGTYQSPILVQWHREPLQARALDVTLTRFA